MKNVKEFLESSILSEADHDDKYHDTLELIACNDEYLNEFVQVFKNSIYLFNKSNILVIVSMLRELIQYHANLDSLYSSILELMYKEDNFGWSISPRIAQILIKIRGEDVSVFKDITQNTDENDTISVKISICSLYSNYPDFAGISDDVISTFLEKISICFDKNKNCNELKQAISTNLLPILQTQDYMGYYEKIYSQIQD